MGGSRLRARTRPVIALVTGDDFPDLYEDDLLLVAALDEIGIVSRPAVWSDPASTG
jgi:hypothetical protein